MDATAEKPTTSRWGIGQRRARWWLPGVLASMAAIPAIGRALQVAADRSVFPWRS